MHARSFPTPAIVLFAVFTACPIASGLGMDQHGNDPVSPYAYKDWPGLVKVLNHPSRFYSTWVNGNEDFYFIGGMEEFNATLLDFANAEIDVHEVVLRPGPGYVTPWGDKLPKEFTWHVDVRGGISASFSTEHKGHLVWSPHPKISLYITEETNLQDLDIPSEITILGIDDESAVVRSGLDSTDKSVRGWGAGVLALLDPYSEVNLQAVIELINDEDDWVQGNAVGAVRLFGAKAKAAEPALKRCLESENEHLRERAQETLDLIESAVESHEEEARHQRIKEKIAKFLDTR